MSRRRGRGTVLRGVLVLIGLALGMVLSACAEPSDPPIRPIRPVDPPNTAGLSTPDPDGPLYLDPKDARNDVERRTGAAGRMVQCTTAVEGGFMPGRYEMGETGPTPEAGLRQAWEESAYIGPEHGFVRERTETERALFVYRVAGQVKYAIVMLDGPALGAPAGWHVESWASCDISEFPPAVWAEHRKQIWTDDAGNPVPSYVVVSAAGPGHCDWQAMTFLHLTHAGEVYVRNPDRELLDDYLAEDWDPGVRLPGNAYDTGFNLDGAHLWLSPDRRRAYVGPVGADLVELWPRTTQDLGCS